MVICDDKLQLVEKDSDKFIFEGQIKDGKN